jgi:hypothetical protein
LIPPASDASLASSDRREAGVAQLVEHFLAKEDVASSSLVTRSASPRADSHGNYTLKITSCGKVAHF